MKKLTNEQQLNKEILETILSSYSKDEINEYYFNHTKKESVEFYGLRNEKQLLKLLKITEYDFSQIKPTLRNCNKPENKRTHESYVAGGKKSAQTQKDNWNNKSEEEKESYRIMQREAHSSEEFKEKIRQINIDRFINMTEEEKEEYARKRSEANKKRWQEDHDLILEKTINTNLARYEVENYTQSDEYRKIVQSEENLLKRAQRTHETKSKNNSFSISTPEIVYYEHLCEKYGRDNIIKQYRDERYPFNCDFYIKSLDLFIELNLTWTHGHHKFDANNPADLKILESWRKKAETSVYYQTAITTWTERDPLKLKTAKENNLNYIVYYSEDEMYD